MPPFRPTAGLTTGVLALALAACTVTPTPVTDGERQARVSADLAQLTRPVEPVTAPITLDEALRRAVLHNLDQRVKLMETAVAQGQLDVVRWDMLPQLSAQAGYRSRNNDAGSFSKNLSTGVENPDVITSAEDRTRRTAGLVLSWNVLDFGLSYARARQAADQTLIAAERQRKVLHNIRQDVRQAYWRAWTAQRLLPEVTRLETRTGRALGESREIERQKLAEPLVALGYQKSLLDTLRELATRRQELELARTELAALMGLPPGTAFRLAPPPANDPVLLALVKTPVEQLIERAFAARPELRQEDYQKRITAMEANKALLGLFPNLNIVGGRSYDSNHYLLNNTWNEVGAGLSLGLLKLFSLPDTLELVERQQQLDELRRLQLGMAIMVQVHLAVQRHALASDDLKLAAAAAGVEQRIVGQTRSAVGAQTAHPLDLARAEADGLLAEVRRALAEAEVQASLARLAASIGEDPAVPGTGTTTAGTPPGPATTPARAADARPRTDAHHAT